MGSESGVIGATAAGVATGAGATEVGGAAEVGMMVGPAW